MVIHSLEIVAAVKEQQARRHPLFTWGQRRFRLDGSGFLKILDPLAARTPPHARRLRTEISRPALGEGKLFSHPY